LIGGMTMNSGETGAKGYEAVIGLEVHAQLLTGSKIFCGCSTRFGAEPNSHTCPVCLGLPGSLPVLNRRAVEFALKFIIAVGGTVNPESVFARKNYFYPDLPKGYQISQYTEPIGRGGYIAIDDGGTGKSISLARVHLEEDAGKSFHLVGTEGDGGSTVDLNRCGVPLIEIVSEPEIRSAREANLFLTRLKQIVEYLEICSGSMEEGALRCDANVSVRTSGALEYGTRTEVKNVNSIRFVQQALDFEINRQIQILESGGEIEQQTLLWDEANQRVEAMRAKEEAADYRYFPEPDLVPLRVDADWIDRIQASLPELPDQRRERFERVYGLPRYDAEVLTAEKPLADYFEETLAGFPQAKTVSNWLMTEVLGKLRESGGTIDDLTVRPAGVAELLGEVESGTISGRMAKEVFARMLTDGGSAREIITRLGLQQVSDVGELGRIIDEILTAHPDEVASYKAGKIEILGFFVGQVMAQTQGRANPQTVNEILHTKLDE